MISRLQHAPGAPPTKELLSRSEGGDRVCGEAAARVPGTDGAGMQSKTPSTVIKKYANRRLYHTGTSTYVTLDDLAEMVRAGEDFVVQDAKSGEDITRGVLGQIIFDAEARGGGLLPIAFLRQLITLYGGHMQGLVPTYLEHSLASFAKEQEKLAKHVNAAIGESAFNAVEEQVRRNMDMFQKSMRMFMPFAGDTPSEKDVAAQKPAAAKDAPSQDAALAKDVAALRAQLAAMQSKVDAMSMPAAAKPAANGVAEKPVAKDGDDDADDGFGASSSPRDFSR